MAKKKLTKTDVEKGKKVVELLLKKYGDQPLSSLEGVPFLETIPRWEDRQRSNIVKSLMEGTDLSLQDVADCLGKDVPYVNNKLFRNTFSIDEIIIIAYICGYTLTFTSNNPDEKEHKVLQLDLIKFFSEEDEDVLARLCEYEYRRKEKKRAEYNELKAQLEKMKKEYGFED